MKRTMRAHLIALIALHTACAASQPRSEPPASTAEGREPALPAHGPEPTASRHEAHEPGDHAQGTQGYDKDFSSADAYAAHFDSAERDAWQKPAEVLRLLELNAGAAVADIGAGTGYFVGLLSTAVGSTGSVMALDTEANMVRHLAHRAQASGWNNVQTKQVAPDDPGLEGQSVDRILLVNTWHHISHRARYAAKLQQALRQGGMVMVVDFTHESDKGPPLKHRLSPEQVVQELEAGGLSARMLEESLPKQYIVVGKRPS